MANLEATFLELMQESAQRVSGIKQQIEKNKREVLTSASEVSRLLEERLNAGVQEVFMNERRIEAETRAVALTVHKAVQQSNQWLKLFHNFDTALKEIGDFENWMNIMESDCVSIAKALDRMSPAKKS